MVVVEVVVVVVVVVIGPQQTPGLASLTSQLVLPVELYSMQSRPEIQLLPTIVICDAGHDDKARCKRYLAK